MEINLLKIKRIQTDKRNMANQNKPKNLIEFILRRRQRLYLDILPWWNNKSNHSKKQIFENSIRSTSSTRIWRSNPRRLLGVRLPIQKFTLQMERSKRRIYIQYLRSSFQSGTNRKVYVWLCLHGQRKSSGQGIYQWHSANCCQLLQKP